MEMNVFSILCIFMLTLAHCNSARIHKANAGDRDTRHAENGASCRIVSAKNLGKKDVDKSSNIAQKAAEEAKAASEAQNIAGQQAARQVKAQLAEKAIEAAKAAEVALSGKEATVERMREEVEEARSVFQEESSSLREAQVNANAAIQAARQSQDQLRTLTSAVHTARSNAVNAQAAADGARRSLQEKQQLLQAAKMRMEELSNGFRIAQQDLAKTNRAVAKASAAAHQAKANATRNKRRLANLRRWRGIMHS